MPATPVWLASAEAVLNRSIRESGQAMTVARRLNNTSLLIDVENLWRIRAAVSANTLMLTTADDSPADASICGSLPAFFELFRRGTNSAGRGRNSRGKGREPAQIRGNAEIAGIYRELVALARPDWEEELSRLVGDVPARRLSKLVQAGLSWARRSGRTAGENLAEYLQEESRDLVNKPELEEFLLGVDQLRETADRVEARLARLEQRLKGTG
jgi:ubiquinone biosynthesis accessory factor UbiJ